ncbi:hypothetical protein TTHERM_00197860 (macronuclear) [Tetrahymena thermophila SB210]|uniref:Uncharacterized protein n=1 Tax=Tetrahymena thermophila (strain SB210) TaxID=312017 RepID=Q22NR3_TETTS|nr:hypothetical protein TTHERM_00197860 [Tetrahymena thermophila SB210]EAR86722.2 hypothetical protein TTHERM_00197860 [Tetrahymena thermophila SB210]|eukprot:XP_001006967.2 hypothetical protein TTHERM_00197860 [Tetrahymena thermophila SB210]
MEEQHHEIDYSQVEQAVQMNLDGYNGDHDHLQQHYENGFMQNNEKSNGYHNDYNNNNDQTQQESLTIQNQRNDDEESKLLRQNSQQTQQQNTDNNTYQYQLPPQQKKKSILDLDYIKIDVVDFKRVDASLEKKVTKRLLFIIEIQCPKTQYQKTIQVTYDLFSKTIIGIVNFGYKLLSVSNYQKLEIADSQNDQQVQEYLKQAREILLEIQSRKDLLMMQQIQHMLQLNDEKNTADEEYIELLPAKLIHKQDIIEEELEISSSCQDVAHKIVYVSQQNITPLSRLGRIWSFIDSQILGSVLAFRVMQEEGNIVPKYNLVSKKYFDFRILCLNYVQEKSLLLLGSHQGYLYYQTIGPNEPLNKKSSSVSIGNEEILKIVIFPSNQHALLMMPSSIRIFDLNSLTVVAGGSLKKRLDGNELASASIDSNNTQIYLGTSKGTLLVYNLNEQKLEYKSKYSFEEQIPISSIICSQPYLFISQGGICTVQKIKKIEPELELQQNGQFDIGKYMNQKQNTMKLVSPLYIKKYQLFISGTDTGMVIFWSVKDGTVLSVIQVTQDQKPIVSIQYIEEENYLLVTLQEGTKILKMGKVEQSLLLEIQKNLSYID